MLIDIGAATDIGRRKKQNEDCHGVFREGSSELKLFDEGALLCVADGLGGHVGGEIASKLAVSVMRDMLKEPPPPEDDDDGEPAMCGLLKEWSTRANANIHATNQGLVTNGKPMGTTLLAAVVTPKKLYISNVGDSRCYLIRDSEFLDMTEDHSWVDEQVKLGMMSKAEAESDRRRNLVTRSIGTHPDVEVDGYRWHIVPGDRILLCTDGLINMVKDADIREEFVKGGTAVEIAQRLVDRANENGGKDNITVIVAYLCPTRARLVGMRILSFYRRHQRKILWALVLLVYGAICLSAGYFIGFGGGG